MAADKTRKINKKTFKIDIERTETIEHKAQYQISARCESEAREMAAKKFEREIIGKEEGCVAINMRIWCNDIF